MSEENIARESAALVDAALAYLEFPKTDNAVFYEATVLLRKTWDSNKESLESYAGGILACAVRRQREEIRRLGGSAL